MTSKKKLQANRSNAKLSTGPKNTDKTRLNATKHGILSGGGVIEEIDGENARNLFDELVAEMWQAMAPIGFLEEDLVYQMVEIKWRHRRLKNWDANLIQIQVDDVKDQWENPKNKWRLPKSITQRSQSGRTDLAMFNTCKEVADEGEDTLKSLASGVSLSNLADSVAVINFAQGELKVDIAAILGVDYVIYEDEGYSPSQVRHVIDASCEVTGLTKADFRTKFAEHLERWHILSRAEQERQRRSYDQAILLASVPDDINFAKMLRYDGQLFNQSQKLLHELQRLQAARLGANLSLPIAVDVNVGI